VPQPAFCPCNRLPGFPRPRVSWLPPGPEAHAVPHAQLPRLENGGAGEPPALSSSVPVLVDVENCPLAEGPSSSCGRRVRAGASGPRSRSCSPGERRSGRAASDVRVLGDVESGPRWDARFSRSGRAGRARSGRPSSRSSPPGDRRRRRAAGSVPVLVDVENCPLAEGPYSSCRGRVRAGAGGQLSRSLSPGERRRGRAASDVPFLVDVESGPLRDARFSRSGRAGRARQTELEQPPSGRTAAPESRHLCPRSGRCRKLPPRGGPVFELRPSRSSGLKLLALALL